MDVFRRFFWRNLEYKISCFFFPRQKWLVKAISRRWTDKPELLVDVISAIVIDFVDGEECFENTDWSYNRSQAEQPIKDSYHWFKWRRQNIEKHIKDLYKIMPTDKFSEQIGLPKQEGDFAEWWIYAQDMEKSLDLGNKRAMITPCKYHLYLWT